MVTICFKGGVFLDFPKENVPLHIFEHNKKYRLETVKDGKKISVFFKGEDVLYVAEPN